AQYEQLSIDITNLAKQEEALKEQLGGWIAKYNIQSETVLDEEKLINLLDFNQDWIEAERSSLRAIDDAVMQAKSILNGRAELLLIHTKQRLSERSLEELTALRTELKESLGINSQQHNEIEFKIKEDVKNKERIGTL